MMIIYLFRTGTNIIDQGYLHSTKDKKRSPNGSHQVPIEFVLVQKNCLQNDKDYYYYSHRKQKQKQKRVSYQWNNLPQCSPLWNCGGIWDIIIERRSRRRIILLLLLIRIIGGFLLQEVRSCFICPGSMTVLYFSYPTSQQHRPFLHWPWLLQSFGQSVVPSSSASTSKEDRIIKKTTRSIQHFPQQYCVEQIILAPDDSIPFYNDVQLNSNELIDGINKGSRGKMETNERNVIPFTPILTATEKYCKRMSLVTKLGRNQWKE